MNLQRLRRRIGAKNDALAARYWARGPIEGIVADRVAFFDGLLGEIWRDAFSVAAQGRLALYAVGGYGRQELHPGSDIDLLILAQDPAEDRREIEPFVRLLFDLNIDVGHSVRSLRDCKDFLPPPASSPART